MESNSKFFEFVSNEVNVDDNFEHIKSLCNTDFEKFCFDVITHTKTFNIDYDVVKEFNEDFNYYVPREGKANTIYGEILRGLHKLCYRYINDGDDINVGPYSGIWHGLKEEFEIPFTYGDNSVQFDYHYEWENFENCGYYFGWKDYVKNIAFATLVIKQFKDFHKENRVDISKYYDNILRFYLSDNIINLFVDNGIDICNNMGFYTERFENQINNVDESFQMKIDEINCYFELEINCYIFKFNKTNIFEHKNLIKRIFEIASIKSNQYIRRDDVKLIEEINNLGYHIEEKQMYHIKGFIVKNG